MAIHISPGNGKFEPGRQLWSNRRHFRLSKRPSGVIEDIFVFRTPPTTEFPQKLVAEKKP
jgi:hypothetical protein